MLNKNMENLLTTITNVINVNYNFKRSHIAHIKLKQKIYANNASTKLVYDSN